MAAALYLSTGLLASLKHPPWLLVFIVFVQATVYLCGPIAAVWNLGPSPFRDRSAAAASPIAALAGAGAGAGAGFCCPGPPAWP